MESLAVFCMGVSPVLAACAIAFLCGGLIDLAVEFFFGALAFMILAMGATFFIV